MKFNIKTNLGKFRLIALLEGLSFIVLVFIAMPLKYGFDLPLFVKYLGWAHGLLFVIYMILLLQCAVEYSWKISKIALAFFAGLLPFGTFYLENKLRKEEL
jgi:integral membrane protein